MAIFSRTKIYELSSNPRTASILYILVLIIFVAFVFFPTTFVLIYVLEGFNQINTYVLSDPKLMAIILTAVFNSFLVSFSVTIIDMMFGLPLAWIISRKKFRGKELLNTLIESPLSVPTAGLGFSVALFWAVTPGVKSLPFGSLQIFTTPIIMMILFHLTTTFPYVVRSLTEILQEVDANYEIAALTCGSSRFTAARTITLPMFRSGIATAAVLSMAKSLSDTGGIVTLLTTMKGSKLVQTDVLQGTALIDVFKSLSTTQNISPILKQQYNAILSMIAFLMIITALIVLFCMKFFIKHVNSPTQQVYPAIEKKISQGIYVQFRNAFSSSFIILFIFIPSFFTLSYLITVPIPSNYDWNPFIQSIFISFIVAFSATFLALLLGLPIAIFITRKNTRFSSFVDSIIDIPYLVPSAALGISVGLFWRNPYTNWLPDIVLVILVHTAMVFPFLARNIVGGLEELDIKIEETARTLGATPLQVFNNITIPSIRGSILAGAVMAFTRSVGETGATSAVSSTLQTAPVYIVNSIKGGEYAVAAMATLMLTTIGYIFILLAKLIINSAQIKRDLKGLSNRWRQRRIVKNVS